MDTAQNGTAGFQPASEVASDQVVWRSRGYLPHLNTSAAVQHVVFRLADSLPSGIRNEIVGSSVEERVRVVDSALDRGHGKRYLAHTAIAEMVQAALLAFDGERYTLVAWCIMPNHVHVLAQVTSRYRLERIVHTWKSFTANRANQLLSRSGPFWAREYFDRYMRDDEHLAGTAAYIEGNPVRAGLCKNIEDWPFSSAGRTWGRLPPASRQDAGGPDMSAA